MKNLILGNLDITKMKLKASFKSKIIRRLETFIVTEINYYVYIRLYIYNYFIYI